MSITMDAKLWKLPGGKRLASNTERSTEDPTSLLHAACLSGALPHNAACE